MHDTAQGGRWQEAARDLRAGVSRVWLWSALGWSDIRQRYSGSLLGSFWITANIALMALVLTFVFAAPLGRPAGEYAAYVTIGLVLWHFVQGALNEATNLFVAAAETIRNAPLPLSVQALRLVWRNLIVLAHNAAIVPLVLFLAGIPPAASAWTIVPALLLLVLASFSAALLLGLLGARFRDVPQIVSNGLQLLFFLTPVFWLPATLGPGRGWFVAGNPIFAFIDIVRAPLIGGSAAASSWPLALGTTAAAGVAAALAFGAWRSRVAYWI
jgi:ABC-type polysaccharide/polyol phosphate export permease